MHFSSRHNTRHWRCRSKLTDQRLRFDVNPKAPRMKLRLAGIANRLNVEHRTSNIERRILMALRFIDFKTSEAQNFEGWFRFAQPFFKLTEFIIRCWTFACSMFAFLVNPSYETTFNSMLFRLQLMVGGSGFQPRFIRTIAVKNRSHNPKTTDSKL